MLIMRPDGSDLGLAGQRRQAAPARSRQSRLLILAAPGLYPLGAEQRCQGAVMAHGDISMKCDQFNAVALVAGFHILGFDYIAAAICFLAYFANQDWS
jgi:hypothetical protein